MVMHSYEREEFCPRTLVDRKRKHYDNAVDVVVRLHDPTDLSTESTAPPSCYLLSMRWFSLEEERVMQQSSVSISLSF